MMALYGVFHPSDRASFQSKARWLTKSSVTMPKKAAYK